MKISADLFHLANMSVLREGKCSPFVFAFELIHFFLLIGWFGARIFMMLLSMISVN